MKKIKKKDIFELLSKICIVIALVIIVACMVIKGYVIYKYSETPISEVPTWAWFWLQGK